MCPKHGKVEKAIEIVRVVGIVYFVHIPRDGFVGIVVGYKPAKKSWKHASRDSPLCPMCKQ